MQIIDRRRAGASVHPFRFFERAVERWPDQIAVRDGDKQVTYHELASRVAALASGFQELDPTFGSRVGICLYNSLDHIVAWLAVLAAGKVWVPLYPKNVGEELVQAAEFTEASIIVTAPEHRDTFVALGAHLLSSGEGGSGSFERLEAQQEGVRPRANNLPLDATQAIKFTGGTTGRPKGVMQPYRAWNSNIVTQIHAWQLSPGDRYLAGAPITHGTSTYILPTLGTGGTLVLLDRPRPQETLEWLQSGGITTTFVPPTVVYMLMQLPDVRRSDYRNLRNIIYGGGPMRPEAIEKAQGIFGPVIASTYGQTEAPQIATMISAQEMMRPEKRASVGRETLLSQVAVLDSESHQLPPGETGEIVIRGDLLMTGYWRQPEVTAKTIKDGWLYTGDLGCLDSEGFLFIRGRSKEMIITGGFNVYPADVEPVLGQHPAVADCAIYGVPDEKWGESVHAAVELAPGAQVTSDEIIQFAKQRLGPVKTPKTVTVYPSIPRNHNGKLQKNQLVEDFLARHAAAPAKEK